MGGGKGSAPRSPDYVGAAQEQGEQNRLAFLEGLDATRINQTGPYGSQQWIYSGSTDGMPKWEDYAARIGQTSAMPAEGGTSQGLGALGGRPISLAYAGTGEGQRTPSGGWTEDALRDLYNKDLQRWQAGNMHDPGSWTLQTTLSPEMQKIYDTGYQRYISAMNGLKTPLNTKGLVARGDWDKLTQALAGDGGQYTDAYYNKATRLLGDKYDRENQALRSQMLNSGLMEGSEAYNNQMQEWMDAKNRNYADIADQAILTGSTMRNQDIGSLVSALTAQDNARAKNLEELTYLRNLPLAEAQTILSGLQVPQFSGGTGGGAGAPNPADYAGALQNQFNADMNRYNADAAESAQTAQTGISLAALAYMMASSGGSDRRLKSNIKPLGRTTSKGFQLYSYDKYGVSEIGVMADEVQARMPEAVITMPSGYLAVDYSMVGEF